MTAEEQNAARAQVLPQAIAMASGNNGAQQGSSSQAKMPPPPPPVQVQAGSANIAPQPSIRPSTVPSAAVSVSADDSSSATAAFENHLEDKKIQKRVANRKSAQLSRKRKKQHMEELKEENDELRRKALILRSIPDLVVVFDSTGKLLFVSHSVGRFLQFTAEELENTSIWDRLCDDSVRLLKAAFMDSLAARDQDNETAPLGSGFWQLRLVDKDGSRKVITMNGVVHFAGDRPECVCSIRPSDDHSNEGEDSSGDDSKESTEAAATASTKKSASTSGGTGKKKSASEDGHPRCLIRVHPRQSVVCNGKEGPGSGSDLSSGGNSGAAPPRKKAKRRGKGNTNRISDSGHSSAESETASGSGSSDE